MAGVVHTYAPQGHTPVLRVPLTRDHLSVISGSSADGHLLAQIQACAFKGPDVVRFLSHLGRRLGGKLLVIWAGKPAHHEAAGKRFGADTGGAIGIERWPGYAPDLNPDEGVWHDLKQVEWRNVACHDRAELRCVLGRAIVRLRHKPDVIRSFFKQFGY